MPEVAILAGSLDEVGLNELAIVGDIYNPQLFKVLEKVFGKPDDYVACHKALFIEFKTCFCNALTCNGTHDLNQKQIEFWQKHTIKPKHFSVFGWINFMFFVVLYPIQLVALIVGGLSGATGFMLFGPDTFNAGSKKITFVRDKKTHTRVIQRNKYGTKVVKFNGVLVPVSKLHFI